MDVNAEQFRQRCTEMCNGGFASLAISVGCRLKLFDHMPDEASAAKSAKQLAIASGCKERYVLEWLRAMVCAGVVDCDAGGSAFWMPEWRRRLLCSDSAESLPFMMRVLSLLSPVSDQVVACFRLDGPTGIPGDNYEQFFECFSRETDKLYQPHLLSKFIPSVDGLQSKLESGINVIDIGCGFGTPSVILATAFPKSNFFGVDICRPAIESANKKKEEFKLKNVNFSVTCAATGMPQGWTEHFDYVTAFNTIHDQAYPSGVLKEIHRILKSGGLLSMVDTKCESDLNIDKEAPLSAAFYTVSLFHCMPVSLSEENGTGLGTMWGRKAASKMLAEAGFQLIFVQEMDYNPNCYHYLCRKV